MEVELSVCALRAVEAEGSVAAAQAAAESAEGARRMCERNLLEAAARHEQEYERLRVEAIAASSAQQELERVFKELFDTENALQNVVAEIAHCRNEIAERSAELNKAQSKIIFLQQALEDSNQRCLDIESELAIGAAGGFALSEMCASEAEASIALANASRNSHQKARQAAEDKLCDYILENERLRAEVVFMSDEIGRRNKQLTASDAAGTLLCNDEIPGHETEIQRKHLKLIECDEAVVEASCIQDVNHLQTLQVAEAKCTQLELQVAGKRAEVQGLRASLFAAQAEAALSAARVAEMEARVVTIQAVAEAEKRARLDIHDELHQFSQLCVAEVQSAREELISTRTALASNDADTHELEREVSRYRALLLHQEETFTGLLSPALLALEGAQQELSSVRSLHQSEIFDLNRRIEVLQCDAAQSLAELNYESGLRVAELEERLEQALRTLKTTESLLRDTQAFQMV